MDGFMRERDRMSGPRQQLDELACRLVVSRNRFAHLTMTRKCSSSSRQKGFVSDSWHKLTKKHPNRSSALNHGWPGFKRLHANALFLLLHVTGASFLVSFYSVHICAVIDPGSVVKMGNLSVGLLARKDVFPPWLLNITTHFKWLTSCRFSATRLILVECILLHCCAQPCGVFFFSPMYISLGWNKKYCLDHFQIIQGAKHDENVKMTNYRIFSAEYDRIIDR